MKKFIYHFPGLYLLMVLFLSTAISCKKIDNWLDVKRNLSDVRPSTLKDFQAIFDNLPDVNENFSNNGLLSVDNVFIPDFKLSNVLPVEKNCYIWAKDIFETNFPGAWVAPYKIVEFSNITVEGLEKIKVDASLKSEKDNILGQALFHRAFAFYNLAQLFCKPYNQTTATSDLGIPIRLQSDVNIPSVRSTVDQTYTQILTDVLKAIDLLPTTQLFKTRPTKLAAKFLLTKVHLSMEEYAKARIVADQVLAEYSKLIDFKPFLVNNNNNPFPLTLANEEVIFYGLSTTGAALSPTRGYHNVDTVFYKLYTSNDRRRDVFYKVDAGYHVFKGSYDQSNNKCFSGFATNEMYFIRAECNTRLGNVNAALADLDSIMRKRYVAAGYVPFSTLNADSALIKILEERRKELPFTGQIRWEDLRRLNNDPRFAVTVKRRSGGVDYILLPNDNKYVFPIPDIEVQQYGLQQNPR